MIFLQSHGISTLFAVRIYQAYGDQAIEKIQQNPYRLADDFYGIGFLTADKVALSMGLCETSIVRIHAAIKHVLAASREHGHCFLKFNQILKGVYELIHIDLTEKLEECLSSMLSDDDLCIRQITDNGQISKGYYSRSLYYQEEGTATRLRKMLGNTNVDTPRVERWIEKYCHKKELMLSDEQRRSVIGIVKENVSILTGGPGCGKTTTTQVIAKLFQSMGKETLLVAPTGRAAHRMTEVIGQEAKTIHRLLEWKGGNFQVNEESPLTADVVIVDECSMLDISLAYALISAVPKDCQLVLIGDPDQLPSVGPGNVLRDLMSSEIVPCFKLTQVFRQAQNSLIINAAHQINKGEIPIIDSPFNQPELWSKGVDCLFIDSDEITNDQQSFINKVRHLKLDYLNSTSYDKKLNPHLFRCDEPLTSSNEQEFEIPKKFKHVDLSQLAQSRTNLEAFKAILKKIHPWSSLHYNLTATAVVKKLYSDWVPKYLGSEVEIQVLSPMARGSLGTNKLNESLQQHLNPQDGSKYQIMLGQRIFRVGDRVIHRRNNYDLNVFNGDIGTIVSLDTENITCEVQFEAGSQPVNYQKNDLMDLDLAYAITIHKSQGSEFDVVIIPILTQHFTMLYRNLIYTGLTRAKKLAVFVGTRRALAMSIKNINTVKRQTMLTELMA